MMADDTLFVLAQRLGRACAERGIVLATAESCTGGLLSGAITEVAGSSDWFDRGFVTYSYEAKIELLSVTPDTLARFGAVSEETAREMASGALQRSRAQLAAAITGIAGPGGGMPGKPVGMVCFAWCSRAGQIRGATHHFAGDRAAVRRQSVVVALEGLLAELDHLA
jgi:nicotinamide-nucleotide amidase